MKKRYGITLSLVSLLMSASLYASQTTLSNNVMRQTLVKNGANASVQGPDAFFTGKARIDPLFPASAATNVSGAYVTFEPGARSAWHIHPAGQTLVVTAGLGWTQVEGGPVEELRPGDVVICPPGVKHWHGASPVTSMTHLALTGDLKGKNVEWLEKVSDEQYQK